MASTVPDDPLVGIIAEGPTDYLLLEAVIDALVPIEVDFRLLQPVMGVAGGFGANGAGWRGVRHFCQRDIVETTGSVARFLSAVRPRLDLLVIHLDADVANTNEIDCACPCPPASDTTASLRNVVLDQWLELAEPNPAIVIAVPAQATETWIVTALDAETNGEPVGINECSPQPDLTLTRPPYRLLRARKRKPDNRLVVQKPRAVYEQTLIPKPVAAWRHVVTKCQEAAKFSQEVATALA